MKHIRLTHADYTIVYDLVHRKRKIEAIKYVRSHGYMSKEDQGETPSHNSTGIGLRDAKSAVDDMTGRTPREPKCCVIIPQLRIKKIILEGEEGDIELDMDGLQLRLLEGLGSLPLSYMTASMELMQYLRDWDNFSTAEK